jgi:hypothetical protein
MLLLPVLLHVFGERKVLCVGLLGYGLQVQISALHFLSVLSVRITELSKNYFSFYHGIESHSILWLHKSLSTR